MEKDQFDGATDSQFISFQDFSPINKSGGAGQAQLNIESTNQQQFGNNLMNDPVSIGMMEDLQGLPERKEAKQVEGNFFTFDFYKRYFNVDTNDVVQRLKGSMMLHIPENYLLSHIRPNPDLYGPFWVCVTLVFSIAISGNLANYFQSANSKQPYKWRYDFHLVSFAATTICLYVSLVPLGLWSAIKWWSPEDDISLDVELIEPPQSLGLLELLCLYGYSLTIYVPVAFLWTVQIGWFQWLLVGVASILSGGVLVRSLFPVIYGKQKTIYLAAILGLHFLLAAGFMMHFFHVPPMENLDFPVPVKSMDPVTIKASAVTIAEKIINGTNT